jgi:hypothetical protein
MRPRLLVWLALGALGLPASGRGDNLDRELFAVAPRLLQHCRDRGYKVVGTLPFRVRLGAAPARLDVHPLCASLADRLENALVLAAGPKEQSAVGILHAAGRAAARRDARATHTTRNGREQLFGAHYPLAWGNKRARPDAFLTGQAEFSADLRQCTVVVEGFARGSKPDKILSFAVATDRFLLADAGLPFALPASRAQALSAGALDALAVQFVSDRLKRKARTFPLEKSLLATLKVSAPGPLTIRPDAGFGQGVAVLPGNGRPWHIEVKNVSGRRLGLLLRVAGYSTFEESVEGPLKARKWIIDPGKTYAFSGYFQRTNNAAGLGVLRPFPPPLSEEPVLGARGQDLVELFVLAEGKQPGERTISLRGFSPRERSAGVAATYDGFRNALAARTGIPSTKTKKIEAGAHPTPTSPSTPPPASALEVVAFPNPTLLEYQRVRLTASGQG